MFKNNGHNKNSKSLQYSFKKQSRQSSPDKENRPVPLNNCKINDLYENKNAENNIPRNLAISNLELLLKQNIQLEKQNKRLIMSNQERLLRVQNKVDNILSIIASIGNIDSTRRASQFKDSRYKESRCKDSSSKKSNFQSQTLRTDKKRNASKSNKAILNSIEQRKRKIEEQLNRRICQHSQSRKQQKKAVHSFISNIR